MPRVIGIDLGTTNSCVSIIEHGDPVVIPNDEGARTTPSVVAFSDNNERLIGQIARRQAVTNPTRTLYAVKRLIGRRFDDPGVQKTLDMVPYNIIEAENGDAWVEINEQGYSPPNISAMILEKMKSIADAYIGEEATQAIVTVPAYFNDAQRQATKAAGQIAGLEVLRIINEPTAAALAYGLGKKEHERIAVFDLGGGTFDISILELDNGVFVVKATNGDTFLGGEDFDIRIMKHLLARFEQQTGIDLRGDNVAMQRLKEASEKAKHELSTSSETDINLPFLSANASGPVHLVETLDRDSLEELVQDLVDRLSPPCEACLEDSRLTAGDLDAVLLVGGMTRMPRIQQKVVEIFGRQPERGINPDEVVAIGAAIQASVLQGEVKDILLLDVTPLTLGIEVAGGILEPIIPRNTTIPCRKSKIFTTALDNQDMVRVHILQGEREMSDDNKSLGKLELPGLPPAPRGVPEIEVTFELDANGIMNVRAKDTATGKAQSMRIVSSSGLSDEEIESMIRDASAYRAEDSRRREAAEARNQLDGLVYNTARSYEEFGDPLSREDAEEIEQLLAAAEDAMESGDLEVIQEAHDALFVAAQRLADIIYSGISDVFDDELFDDDDVNDDLSDPEGVQNLGIENTALESDP
jgi:molecular chaperone DnaK